MVVELLREIYTLVKEMSHPKPPNLPSFWPLTPERKVTFCWSHRVLDPGAIWKAPKLKQNLQ